jgi:hypothetical protein
MGVQLQKEQGGIDGREKLNVVALAVFAVGFGPVLR